MSSPQHLAFQSLVAGSTSSGDGTSIPAHNTWPFNHWLQDDGERELFSRLCPQHLAFQSLVAGIRWGYRGSGIRRPTTPGLSIIGCRPARYGLRCRRIRPQHLAFQSLVAGILKPAWRRSCWPHNTWPFNHWLQADTLNEHREIIYPTTPGLSIIGCRGRGASTVIPAT